MVSFSKNISSPLRAPQNKNILWNLLVFLYPLPFWERVGLGGNVRRDNLGKLNYYSFRKNGDLM